MNNFKVTLENKITNNIFKIDLVYEPQNDEEIDFKFGNSSKALERNDLEFLDSDLKPINPIKTIIINPINREKIQIKVSKSKPFIYSINGEIDYLNNKVCIKLASVEYILDKGKSYFLQLRYKGKISERITLEF